MAGQKRLIQEASIVNNIRTDEGLQVKRGREVLAMPRLASNAIVIAFTVQHLYCYIVLIHAKPQARAVQHSDHRCRDEGSAEKILDDSTAARRLFCKLRKFLCFFNPSPPPARDSARSSQGHRHRLAL